MIQRSTSSGCTVLPCSHPHRRKPQRLSLLSSVILYVFRSHNFGHIKPLDHHRKTHLLLASKARWFSSISPSKMSGKKDATSSATQSFKRSILSYQPSMTTTTIIIRILSSRYTKICPFWPGILPKKFPWRELHVPQGFFFYIISREFQGYFYFFLYSDTQVILWTFKGILFEFLYIYLYFCFVFFGNAPNKYKEE